MPVERKFKITKDSFFDIVFLLIGSFLFAVSVNVFTAPNDIVPGGLTGVATMLNHIFNFPIGISILLLNIPIFIWAIIEVNFRFMVKTLIATFISSIMVDLTANLIAPYNGDLMLASLFGGAISGIGLGLIFMRGATTGGTDLIANLIGRHLRHVSLGRLVMIVDLVIVVLAAFVYKNYESPMYSVVSIFVMTKMIDTVIYGTSRGTGKLMFIISKKSSEIADGILHRLDRGVTYLKSKGAYSGVEGEVLMCAVRKHQVYKINDLVKNIDPEAFIIIGDTAEVIGEGFLSDS